MHIKSVAFLYKHQVIIPIGAPYFRWYYLQQNWLGVDCSTIVGPNPSLWSTLNIIFFKSYFVFFKYKPIIYKKRIFISIHKGYWFFFEVYILQTDKIRGI